ncbi:MAG: hypothetical protein NTZ65_00270 [Candidatus Berkelbacteria bacterium]|nr:hypothetical protein [Candidatus Berkelbacteria bacterium]
MLLLIRLLLSLDIIASLIAAPIFAGGFGLGSGAGGSSFSQQTDLNKNDSDKEAAYILLTNSCDAAAWNQNAPSGPKFPTSSNDTSFSSLVSKAKDLDWGKLCQAKESGKYGIIFVGSAANEMKLMFQNKWDKRTLYATVYLFQKRFSASGYNESCEGEIKNSFGMTIKKIYSPLMTLAVHFDAQTGLPYNDSDGSPSKLSKEFVEDDAAAADPSVNDRNVSPHARGQAFDVVTLGCNKIYAKGKLKAIQPTYIQTGQTAKAKWVNPAIEDILNEANQINDEEGEDAIIPSSIGDDPPFASGVSALASSKGLSAALAANGQMNPQNQPKILPQPSDTNSATAPSTTDARSSNAKKAAAYASRVLEQKLSLPAGTLQNGTDLKTAGRAAFLAKTGFSLPDPITDQDIPPTLLAVINQQSADFALEVPQEAIDLFKQKKYDEAYKLIGASDLNRRFELNLNDSQIKEIAKTGKMPNDQIKKIIASKVAKDPNEQLLYNALLDKGYDGVDSALDEFQSQQEKQAPYKLVKIMISGDQLTDDQKSILADFMSNDPVIKDGAKRRMREIDKSKALADWMTQNGKMTPQEVAFCQGALDLYKKSSNPKEELERQNPDVKTKVLANAISLMGDDEKLALTQVVGPNPSPKDLEAAMKDGRLEDAGKVFAISKQLEQAGVAKSDANQLAAGLVSHQASTSDAAIAVFNGKYSSQYGVNLTKDDFKNFKTGQISPVAQTIAYGKIKEQTGLDVNTIKAAFKDKNPQAKEQVAQAAVDKINAPAWSKKYINDYVKDYFQKDKQENISKAGADQKADSIGASIDKNNQEKKTVSDQLKDAYHKAIDKGDLAARDKAASVLQEYGMGEKDAQNIAAGHFDKAQDKALAAVLAKQGYGSYDQMKTIIDGSASKDTKYNFSDPIIADVLNKQGIQLEEKNVSKTLLEGTSDQREKMAKDAGEQYAANELSTKAGEMGVAINKDQAKEIIKNHDWGTFKDQGSDIGKNSAAQKVSESLGGTVSPEQVRALYDKATSDGLDTNDAKNLGWGVLEEQTGFSKDSIDNFRNNFDNLKDITTTQIQNFDYSGQGAAIGTGVILNTVIGQQLAAIDPTGGLATSYAMTYAQDYLATLGVSAPILLGVAFLINPQATIASIKNTIQMAFGFISDPVGTIMGFLGGFGIGGSKPKAFPPVNKPDFGTLDKVSSGALTAAGVVGASGNIALSGYQGSAKPSKSYFEKAARREVDHITEDMLMFSLIQKSPALKADHWTRFMGKIELPSSPLEVEQIFPGRIASKTDLAGVSDRFYDQEGSGSFMGLDNLNLLLKAVYGASYDPLKSYGRKQGLLYSKTIPDRVHIGF